jgi:hypothetical protein
MKAILIANITSDLRKTAVVIALIISNILTIIVFYALLSCIHPVAFTNNIAKNHERIAVHK